MHGSYPAPIDSISTDRLSVEARAYLASARQRGFLDRIHAAFERADKLKIVFVGETIIDEYCFVKPLARPSKEFILATVAVNEPESFFGGVMAAARQGEWRRVEIVSIYEQVIRKTRYVDGDFSRKLFEVYSGQQIVLSEENRACFRMRLDKAVHDADVVIVFDFGHGLMGEEERRIVDNAKFLAVNAQTNAGNAGFNPVTKYRRADYVCVDEPEARLATGDQYGLVEDLAQKLTQWMQCGGVVITRGRNGATVSDRTQAAIRAFGIPVLAAVPAFATHGIDTIGAGDAFLAVTAPLLAAGLDLETAAFVGNVAGAIKIDIVGHRRHVERAELISAIDGLLK